MSPQRTLPRPPFEVIALVLQGGGALGAYQGGVYQALHEAAIEPDWIGGISIGAINAAIIAGNPPERRLERLRQFWETVTAPNGGWMGDGKATGGLFDFLPGNTRRSLINEFAAHGILTSGAPGFFKPRLPNPWLWPSGSLEATSWYDTSALRGTLEALVDFDLIKAGKTRLSVGAVNVKSGNFVYFDSTEREIRPEHIMASGALPPGFAAVPIDGELYWDGGLVSNTPLQWVTDCAAHRDTLAFQVDLWNARGQFPRNLSEVMTRIKEIEFSSRTRAMSDRARLRQVLRNAVAVLGTKLPPELRDAPEMAVLRSFADAKAFSLVQLIYRSQQYEGASKDYEFSRQSMEDHWRAGYDDTVRTLADPRVLQRPDTLEGVHTFDIADDGSG